MAVMTTQTKNPRIPPQRISELFEKAAQEFGVPYEIINSVAYQESRYNPNALGKAGEKGIMQLMPFNWEPYGVTDPFDPWQSIQGGSRLLRNLYEQLGNWPKALAAYNWGIGNVKKRPNPNQWPDKVKRYVSRVLIGADITQPFFFPKKTVK